MRALVTLRSLVFFTLALTAACAVPRDEGSPCESTEQCLELDDELECVAVLEEDDEVVGACLPLPRVGREETSCTDDLDCAAAAFPVEAECVEDRCQCPTDNILCEDAEIANPFTCGCVRSSGDEGTFCLVEDSCLFGLNCKDNTCQRGSAAGDRCSFDFGCVGADLACDEDSGICRGEPGVACRGDADCQTFSCFDGVCE